MRNSAPGSDYGSVNRATIKELIKFILVRAGFLRKKEKETGITTNRMGGASSIASLYKQALIGIM